MITEFIPAKYRRPLRFARLAATANDTVAKKFPQVLHAKTCPLVIGPSLDPVFRALEDEIGERAHLLAWENFLRTWDYRISGGRLEIVADGVAHAVSGVYVRGFEPSENDPNRGEMFAFLSLLRTLRIPRLGTADLGISNTSKILHLHVAVRAAAKGLRTIKTPETLLIKSASASGADLARRMGPSVAKSLSSTRTQVFDDRKFRHFAQHRPAFAPVLIQKKKTGLEVRVHVIDGELFPLGIRSRVDQVDYRYNDFEVLFDVRLSDEEAEFCRRIQKIERNPLVGVDLIREDGLTYCFEANPNPGWASFEYPAEMRRRLANAILSYLSGEPCTRLG